MGKIEKLMIELDDPQLVYNPGETINGKVVLDVQGDVVMKAVWIKLRGKAYVAWKVGKNNYIFQSEDYIDNPTTVFGPREFNNRVGGLRTGHHSFPFRFTIPVGVPGSFERPVCSQDCYVRYWLKTYIDGTRDEYKMAVQVASALDLNFITDAMEPSEKSKSKNVCCCCCRKGPITVRAKTDRQCYVPGDIIRAEIEVEDNTGRGTNDTTVKLMQNTTSISYDNETRLMGKSVAKVTRGGIEPNSSDSWVQEIEVPPLSVSGLPGCRLIDIQYSFFVAVNIRSTPSDLKITIPIIIGSIPHGGGGHAYPKEPTLNNSPGYRQSNPRAQESQYLGHSPQKTIENSRGQGEPATPPPPYDTREYPRTADSARQVGQSSAGWNEHQDQKRITNHREDKRREFEPRQDAKQLHQRNMTDSLKASNGIDSQYASQDDNRDSDRSHRQSERQYSSQYEERPRRDSYGRSREHSSHKNTKPSNQCMLDNLQTYSDEPDNQRYSGVNERVSLGDVALQTKESVVVGNTELNQGNMRENSSRHSREYRARGSGHNQQAAEGNGPSRHSEDGSSAQNYGDRRDDTYRYPEARRTAQEHAGPREHTSRHYSDRHQTQNYSGSREDESRRYSEGRHSAQSQHGRSYSGNSHQRQDHHVASEGLPQHYSEVPQKYTDHRQPKDTSARHISEQTQLRSPQRKDAEEMPPPPYQRSSYEMEDDQKFVTML